MWKKCSVLVSFGIVMSWYLASHFTEKEGNFFFSSANAICSILLKYQEIYVEIQTFTDENWYILRSCSFESYWESYCSRGGSDGGAILFLEKKLLVRSSYFENNNAAYRGGAISVIFRYSKCNISNSSFETNNANNTGGAIMFFGKELLIKQSSSLGNIADNGGALYFMADEQDRQLNDYKFKLDPLVDLKTVKKPNLNRLKY